MTPIILLDQLPAETVVHMHRFGYHPLTTTHLAQDVEQLVPVSIAYHVVQHLGYTLTWRGDVGKLTNLPRRFYR